MKQRKLWLVVSLVLLAGFALAACAPATPTEAPAAGAPAAEPVNISVWHAYTETEEQLFNSAVESFMADNPNITIEVLAVPFDELQNKFQTEVAAGGGPTLVTGPQDRMAGYADAGLLKGQERSQ